jgi:hypothetical protein
MKYNILAEVSGGVTGTRSALLKNGQGGIWEFEDAYAANSVATTLNATMNGPNARASFRYTVIESVN